MAAYDPTRSYTDQVPAPGAMTTWTPPPQSTYETPLPAVPPTSAPAETPAVSGSNNYFDTDSARRYTGTIDSQADRLLQPVNNPDFGPMTDYLRKYFQQLQGPAYTPAQMELMQTQALDPMEQQRTAAKQQVMRRLAAQGITPSSGILERAMQDVDRSFNQMRTRTQAGFATQAIGQGQQNAALAAQVGQTLSGLQNQQQGLNESRGLQAVQLLGLIPQLEDQRLMNAASFLQSNSPFGYNPFAASQSQMAMQNQNSQAWQQGLWNLLSQFSQQSGWF